MVVGRLSLFPFGSHYKFSVVPTACQETSGRCHQQQNSFRFSVKNIMEIYKVPPQCQFPPKKKRSFFFGLPSRERTYISHRKRKQISTQKCRLQWDMLVPTRVNIEKHPVGGGFKDFSDGLKPPTRHVLNFFQDHFTSKGPTPRSSGPQTASLPFKKRSVKLLIV